jgi:hypothetical protein
MGILDKLVREYLPNAVAQEEAFLPAWLPLVEVHGRNIK